MHYSINREHWLPIEAEMIANTHLPYLLPIKWEETEKSDVIRIHYEIPAHTYTLKQLLENNQLNAHTLNDLCLTLKDLNQTLQSYMLSHQHLLYHPENIRYSSQHGKFFFSYLPDADHEQNYTDIDLLRHLVIETEQFHLIKHLKSNAFDMDVFLSKLNQKETSFWQRFIKVPRGSAESERSNTPQRQVYPMLLDRYNPTVIYKLFFDQNTIGRDEQSNVCLDDLSISRNHGMLFKSGRQFIYKDLLSTNGSKINGSLCDREHAVVNGDIIQIGEKEFIFIR